MAAGKAGDRDVKAQHRRPMPYRPRLEFAIGLVALAVCGLGIGLVMVDVLDKDEARISPQPPTTTSTVMINSAVVEPETTTTLEPTTTVPRLAGRGTPAPVIKKVAAAAPVLSSTTTTTKAPTTALRIAQAEVGKTGSYAEGGFWCARFVSWAAEQAEVGGWQSNDSPARLHATAMDEGRIVAEPYPGVMVFIDLTGQNFANQYISHVGIVESVNGDEFVSIEGNSDNSGQVKRVTRKVGDGYVVSFAAFGSES
jgi:hypothetical protein